MWSSDSCYGWYRTRVQRQERISFGTLKTLVHESYNEPIDGNFDDSRKNFGELPNNSDTDSYRDLNKNWELKYFNMSSHFNKTSIHANIGVIYKIILYAEVWSCFWSYWLRVSQFRNLTSILNFVSSKFRASFYTRVFNVAKNSEIKVSRSIPKLKYHSEEINYITYISNSYWYVIGVTNIFIHLIANKNMEN